MPSLSTQLIVIGGGATGLGVAWDACLRGIKVVLIEQSDLGQGTSGRYHGLLHSGGRYVLSDPPSATDCARENEILRRLAPTTIEDTGGLFVSAPADTPDFPDRWLAACQDTGVQAQEISRASVLQREPLLSPNLVRCFEVRDASLDSFDLLHLLCESIRARGGQVRLRHRVDRLVRRQGAIVGAEAVDLATGDRTSIGAEMVVNAAGPWARSVASLAGVDLPIALGRGAMLAMASRLVNTVVNRCKPPADGDILVPVGTVSILGTTDEPVEAPDDLTISPWEIDLLLAEAEILVPGIAGHRALRAWSGIRPLYRPAPAADASTRSLPRAHTILDHGETHGVRGFVSVIGGKLTTFRLMAEQVLQVIAPQLGADTACSTATTPLEPPARRKFHRLPNRLEGLERARSASPSPVLCECELVTRADLESALEAIEAPDLDDLRRDLRLGMGPCQAAFCGYRAAGLALRRLGAPADGGLAPFLQERWRGLRPLGWGHMLRQMEFGRRVALELFGLAEPTETS